MATTYTVGTDKDYATLTLALNAVPSNLSSTEENAIVIDSGTYSEAIVVRETDFSNPSATDFISFDCASGDEHNGTFGSGVVVNGVVAIYVRLAYTRVRNIEGRGGSNSVIFGNRLAASVGVVFENCIAYIDTDAVIHGFNFQFGCETLLINCGVVITNPILTQHHGFLNVGNEAGGHGGTITSCYGCWSSGATLGFTSAGNPVGNDPIMNTDNCWAILSWTSNFSASCMGNNNTSDDGTIPTGSDNTSSASIGDMNFTDYVNYDFNIDSDSILAGAGDDFPLVYTEDIKGDTISLGDYPIGSFLPPSGGGGGNVSNAVGMNLSLSMGL